MEEKVLLEFKSDLTNLYGERLKKLILFGSYARGDFREFSDIDLLAVLTDMESPYKELHFTSNLTHDYLLKYDLVISLLATTEQLYSESNLPLYRNVKKEGIEL